MNYFETDPPWSSLYQSSHVSVYTPVLVAGAGELQQRENCFAVSSQDHGEPHRSGLEPRDLVRRYINNLSAANAYNPPPQEQQCSVST